MRSSGRPLAFLLGLSLLFGAGALPAQDVLDLPLAAPPAEWQPPELEQLPADWWLQLESGAGADLDQRFSRLEERLREAVGRLDGDQLLAGQASLQAIRTQYELLRLARAGSGEDAETFAPVPARDRYSLDEFLALRHEAERLEQRQNVPRLRIDELSHQAELVRDRADALRLQYQSTDASTPERLLLGLRLIEARLVAELAAEESRQLGQRIAQIGQQQLRVEQQLESARTHLVVDPETRVTREAREEAATRTRALSDRLASVQRQLLDALSAPQARPSLLALRKQQLTRASVEQTLARLEQARLEAAHVWQRQRIAGEPADPEELAGLEAVGDVVREALGQVETWTAATRATLLNPAPEDDLNAVKNMELAQSVAQETLALLDDVNRMIGDLQVIGDLVTAERLGMEHGLRSLWTRLRLLAGGAGEAVSDYLDVTLFHVGDVPVTIGSILKMLVILVVGWAISWFIRHLVERLKSRRQFASSPVVYTLSRLLHYIIIFIAVLAAFGSIGLDFSNFALIAGALSVGIGFGLQSVVNNFVSGLILLFEGSLRVGDYIELDTGLRGVVKEINTRATVINTNDSIDVVVPNSQFVTNQLTNWTLREPLARFRIEFGVAYGSDKEAVKAAALEAARRVDYIVHNTPSRPVEVWLTGFGDSALVFQLLAWVSKAGVLRPERVRSAVLWQLETQLRERGIEIPFPQRDLHLRSGFLRDPAEAPGADAGPPPAAEPASG